MMRDPDTEQPLAIDRVAVYLIILMAVIIAIASKGILSEGTVAIGDMPRHAMNGVFLYDALRDLPLDPLAYAYRYFARYPALSLGHHPMLLPLAEVPAYAICGISIFSSRLVIICFALVAGVLWFFMIRALYDDHVAFFSSLLFVTSPAVVYFARVTMSEMPALACLVLTVSRFQKYVRSGRIRDGVICGVCLAVALYAKLLLVCLIPLLALALLIERGPKAPSKRTVLIVVATIIGLSLPLVVLTGNVAKASLIWVFFHPGQHFSIDWLWAYPGEIWRNQLSLAAVVLCCLGLVLSIIRRSRRELFFLMWILLVYVELLFIGPNQGRYSIYWIPPLCLFAALPIRFMGAKALRAALVVVLIGVCAFQVYRAAKKVPQYAEGYEEAARFVVQNKAGTLFYSAGVDDGYFVFFVRKYDEQKQMIVLLADKILATSNLNVIVKDLISERWQIYEALQTYGVRYLVIEDVKTTSRALEWLREEARTDRFILRKVIPIRSNGPRLQGTRLMVYEYRYSRAAQKDAVIRIDVPLMGKEIAVPLADLTK